MKNQIVTDIVVDELKRACPGLWQFARKNSHTDDVGNPISVRDDGICWESASWVEYDLLDRINERIEEEGLPIVVEYANSYEVTVEAL